MSRQYISHGRDLFAIEKAVHVHFHNSQQFKKNANKYIVGLDLGDGDCCLSYIDTEPSLSANRFIFSLDGKETVPSAVAEAIDGSTLIGEEAVIRPDASELEVNFKYSPSLNKKEWERRRDKILLFVKELFKRFFEQYPQIEGNCEIFVGCPSSWDDVSREIYEQHLVNEDLPTCYVVPESRAAIIQALDLSEKYKNQVNQKHFRKLIHKRVLLIDIGSSTIDVTALDDLEAYEAKIGDDFGLRLVDQQLLKTLIKKHPERMKLKRRIEEDRRDERFLHYLCRLAKEHAFSRSVNPARFFEQREWAESCWSFLLRTDLSNCLSSPFFWEDEDSWLDRYRSLLQKLKNSEFFGRPDVLILTGGGSNIRQLLDEAISVFPAAVPARDPEPSLSVSRGLAGYGQWRKNVDAFYGDAITLVQSSKVESEISLEMIPFVSEVARILLESSVEAVWQPMAYKWKNEKLNINDQGGLVSYIVKLYREWLNNGNDILFKPSLDRLSDAANHALRDDIKKLSIRHGIPVDGFKIELRLLPNEFLMPISYGGGLLSKIAKGYQLYENLNFQLIDKAPNWLRKFCDSSGLLDFALESERIMKQILASVTASHYQTGVSPEIHESIIRFVRDAAKKEIDKQLHTVEKILLGGHKNLSNKVK